MTAITQTEAWQALAVHQRELAEQPLKQLFADDPQRFRRFSIEFDGLLFDYSKQRVNADTMALLLTLAEEAGLPGWRERLFRGEPINHTEQRPALHTALRGEQPLRLGDVDLRAEVSAALARLEALVEAVRSGAYRGYTGEPISDLVHIGIGGSDLGPRLALQALATRADGPRVHFVSNIDGVELADCLRQVDPARTLFSIASKSFGTRETLVNGEAAKAWLRQASGSEAAVRQQFLALTGAADKARAFGIADERIFPVWDWVGGRYSLWSAVGLPVALACGMDVFRQLLAGAAEMDRHFREAPLEANMPVVMALLGIWCRNFEGMASQAVIPYSERLGHLPAYLQQLEMESNGKAVTRDGRPVDYPTVPVLWGQTGTVGQHAFFQALHQGTTPVPVDFIGVARTDTPYPDHHRELLANLLAQSEALMRGQDAAEARAQLQAQGLPAAEVEAMLPFRVFPGDRPSTTILLAELSPQLVGRLIALYEHKVFCQSVIWDVNAFDQWGVELGKRLAGNLLPALARGEGLSEHDSSTRGLVQQCRQWGEGG